jgi:hypothetical protein
MVGATWALAWFPIGCVLAVLAWKAEFPSLELSAIVLGIWTALGGMSGTLFALLLALYERGQSLGTLRPARLALWGTAAGAGIPLAIYLFLLWLDGVPPSIPLLVITGALGACCAVATIALARRGRAADGNTVRAQA